MPDYVRAVYASRGLPPEVIEQVASYCVFAFMGEIDVFPTLPILFDPDSTVSEAYGVKELPTSFIVDKQGRIVYRAVGGREFDHPDIVALIRELIAERPQEPRGALNIESKLRPGSVVAGLWTRCLE